MRPIAIAEPKKGAPQGGGAKAPLLDVNDAPVLDLNGAPAGSSTTISYGAGQPLTRIAPAGTVIDPDSADFHGGSLRVGFSGTGTSTDMLAIATDATVTLTGNDHSALRQVKINGTLIGTVSGGGNGTDLVISLHSSATPAQVQILLEHIGYANSSASPSTQPRTVTFTLIDGDGTANGGHDTGTAAATITLPTPDSTARFQTCTIIGKPRMSAIGFPGSRVEAIRAGIMTRVFWNSIIGLARARQIVRLLLYVLKRQGETTSFCPHSDHKAESWTVLSLTRYSAPCWGPLLRCSPSGNCPA